jgi:hypothetical protein
MALLTAAELASAQAAHAPVAARRRYSAEASATLAAAEQQHRACAVPDPSFTKRAQALREQLAQLSQ